MIYDSEKMIMFESERVINAIIRRKKQFDINKLEGDLRINLNKDLENKIIASQKSEITEHLIYKKIASFVIFVAPWTSPFG